MKPGVGGFDGIAGRDPSAAEIELAAFDVSGAKLWTRFVEPPWGFQLEPDRVVLDVMGSVSQLDRRTGGPV